MQDISHIVQSFEPISLAQMESVKLMNRIDTKYAVPMAVLPQLLEAAKADYYVQEIDGKRIAAYDTMYYDTDLLDMYMRHHDRQLVRQKIRIRQYVDSNLTFLEIKRKNNKGRTSKKRIIVPGFDITADTPSVLKHKRKEDETVTVAGFIDAKSRYEWSEITPHLWTRFRRITPEQLAKRERHKNLTVKEWNTDSKTNTRWLDRIKVYDEQGRCIEEIEYATYGQKWRVTSKYDDVTGKVIEEVEYNDRNRPTRIKKYEWNENGTKAKQYNYLPNGKLYSVKVYEYIFSDR
jgi:hypothetical protein